MSRVLHHEKKEKNFGGAKLQILSRKALERGGSSRTWRNAIQELGTKMRKTLWGSFAHLRRNPVENQFRKPRPVAPRLHRTMRPPSGDTRPAVTCDR
jgi:hypothetical protein